MFDFNKAEAAKEASYLKPGVYTVKISEVKLDKFPKGQPYLGFTFETEDGQKLTEKMGFTSDKAKEVFMSRLQYLHEAWTNKKLNKVFKSIEEIESYFAKTFVNAKASTRKVIFGGEDDGKNVYASLPFTNFIVTDDSLDEGEFEQGSAEWKKYVKPRKQTEASGKPNGLLNADENDGKSKVKGGGSKASGDTESEDEDTPW